MKYTKNFYYALPVTFAMAAISTTTTAAGDMTNWAKASTRQVVLFYPGESSMEWTLRGSDHGGARAYRSGDRCFDCHDQEAKDIGQKIVTGEKLEPNVIPGKRGSIPMTVNAAHDGTNLYLRFTWPDGKHAPVPFAKGGKMDPANPIKLAMMIAPDSVEHADRAGCWGTCHIDINSMPLAPAGKEPTKYIAESRTEVEYKGDGGKTLGGLDKRKPQAEIDAALKAGQFMDLIRYSSGSGKVEDGYVLADRVMQGGQGAVFKSRKDGANWVVEMKRPLKSSKPGDVSMELNQVYNIGFAIHDDHSKARYHHVSVGYKLGFDNNQAEINAVRK